MKQTWESLRPILRQGNGASMTGRDAGNAGLSTAFVVVAAWGVHDVVGVDMPPEVVAALAVIVGYITARILRY